MKYEEKLNEKIDELINNSKESNTEESTTTASNDDIKEFSMDIPALSIFNIQVGSFSEKTYADKHITQMENEGLVGHVIEKDGYKVIAMSFLDRESANKYKESIREIYSDAFIAAINLPVREITYDNSGNEYANVAIEEVKKLIEYYNNFNSFFANNKFDEINNSEINQFIDDQIVLLSEIKTSISNIEPTKDFTEFNSNLIEIVDSSTNSLEEIKENNFTDKLQLMKIFMDSVNKYAEII